MNIIILIDEQQAIPVRAIPFVTGWGITPELVASIFAHTDPLRSRFSDVETQHLSGDGTYSPMLPKEWDGIELDFKLLLKTVKATRNTLEEHRSMRERQLICMLPEACFVGKDHFEKAFKNAYSTQNYEILNERSGDRELNFSPYVPDNLQEAVMEGFSHLEEAITQRWPWGNYETPLLSIMAAAVSKWCLAGEYPQKKTGKVQEGIKAEMKKAGIPISETLVDHIETLISPRLYSHTRQRVNRKD